MVDKNEVSSYVTYIPGDNAILFGLSLSSSQTSLKEFIADFLILMDKFLYELGKKNGFVYNVFQKTHLHKE